MDAQTGAVTSIPGVLSEDLFPGLPACISPDGRKLYFRRGEEANPSKAGSIIAYELETGRQQELFRSTSERILSLAISRDGRQLAFVVDTGVDDASSLQVLSVDGGPPRQIFAGGRTGDGLIGSFGIAWTHDDRFILFITYRSEPGQEQASDLWRISPDGGAPQRILAMIPGLLLPNVHPDGRRLTFTAGQRERSEVWVMENFLPPLKAAR
jgi:Tol biopolymer transport system component